MKVPALGTTLDPKTGSWCLVFNAPHGVDLVMPHDVQVTVQSSNALLLDQIAKVAKGKSVTITFQWT